MNLENELSLVKNDVLNLSQYNRQENELAKDDNLQLQNELENSNNEMNSNIALDKTIDKVTSTLEKKYS